MVVPALSSSDPAHGATDVYTNKNPTFIFTAALDSATVTENTFLLLDQTTNQRVPVTLTYDSTVFKVTMVLQGMLRENTAYRVLIVGSDTAVTDILSGTEAGDDLTATIKVEFSTGDDQFQIDTTLGKEVDSKTLEGELFLPSNLKALGTDFTVDKVRPQNHSHGVAVDLTGDRTVRFTFTKNLNTSGDIGAWAEIEVFPVLTTEYLGKSGELQTVTAGDYTLPTGTLSVSSKDLVLTFDRDFPNNVGISVQLLDKIEASDGLDYGGGLEYSITTKLYPDVVPVIPIKRELRSIDGDKILDDYVGSLVHKNTIFLWEFLGRDLDLDDIPWAGWKYIFNSTLLDIMEDQDYEKFLTAGTRRQLGDLNTSVDSLIGRLALKIASTQKDKDRALQTLTKGWQFKTAIKSDSVNGLPNQNRLWYDINGRWTDPANKYNQPDIPASNTAISRRAKSVNPWW